MALPPEGSTCCNCGEKITGDQREHVFDDGKIKHTFAAAVIRGHFFCASFQCGRAAMAQISGRRNQSDCKCRSV